MSQKSSVPQAISFVSQVLKRDRAVFGLTCSKYQSGEIDRSGRISRCGDEMLRVMLYKAAQSMLWSKKWSLLKAWVMQIARRRGNEIGDCRLGTPAGCDCASHLG